MIQTTLWLYSRAELYIVYDISDERNL